MSTVTATSETYTASGTPLPGMKQFGMIAGVLGVVLAVAGFFLSGIDRFFQAYLVAYTFWMGVALGSLAQSLGDGPHRLHAPSRQDGLLAARRGRLGAQRAGVAVGAIDHPGGVGHGLVL